MPRRECDLCRFELGDDFEIGQRPNVPSLVPCRIEGRGDLVVVDQLCWVPLAMLARCFIIMGCTYWLIFGSHTRLPVAKLDMTLSQQVGVFPINLLIGDEKITTRVSGAHANIVSEIDGKVAQISNVGQTRLEF